LEYNIDFSEPIPKMVQRLRAEHRQFRLELIQIEEANEVSSHKAIEMLKEIKKTNPTSYSRRRSKNHANYYAKSERAV
jgi:hypothetical protein